MGLAAQLQSLDDERLAALLTARRDLVEHPTSHVRAARDAGSRLRVAARLPVRARPLPAPAARAGRPGRLAHHRGPVGRPGRAERRRAPSSPTGSGASTTSASSRSTPASVRLVGELASRLGVPGLGRPARRCCSTGAPSRSSPAHRRRPGRPTGPALAAQGRPAGAIADHVSRILPRLRQAAGRSAAGGRAPPGTLDRQGCATLVYYGSFGFGAGRGQSSDPGERAIRWLLERGLLVQTILGHGELVGEVGLLRPGRGPLPRHLGPSTAAAPLPHGPPAIDLAGEAGAAAGRVVDLLARLCHPLEAEPAPLLKTGGPRRPGAAAAGREQRPGRARHRRRSSSSPPRPISSARRPAPSCGPASSSPPGSSSTSSIAGSTCCDPGWPLAATCARPGPAGDQAVRSRR